VLKDFLHSRGFQSHRIIDILGKSKLGWQKGSLDWLVLKAHINAQFVTAISPT
jgi:hypothetical protein